MAAASNQKPSIELPASTRVAGIYELLEQILAHSEPHRLLTMKRISKYFRELIDSSQLLATKFQIPLNTEDDPLDGPYTYFPVLPGSQIRDSHCKYLESVDHISLPGWAIQCEMFLFGLPKSNVLESWRNILIARETTKEVWGVLQSEEYGEHDEDFEHEYEYKPTKVVRKFTSNDAITIGMLVDWAEEMRPQRPKFGDHLNFTVVVDETGRSLGLYFAPGGMGDDEFFVG